ncbi:MAG: ribonuclease III [Bacilli bacterium]|nr:ribonuclease III [Bacilli bacterium]
MKTLEKYGIKLENNNLLKEALTHSSYAYEHGVLSYERLEFLGDAVLELVFSDYIYKTTNDPEGVMSKLRSHYVCENALCEYAKSINLKDYIRMGNGLKEANKTIIADVFEAIIAVIYLEHGIDKVKDLFNQIIVPYIEDGVDFIRDYKSLLQESVQPVKKVIEYKVVEESGPAHQKFFKVNVIIDGIVYGFGEGSTKKEAEQMAAEDAYNKKV